MRPWKVTPDLLNRNTFRTYEEKINPYSVERKIEFYNSFFGTGKTHLIQSNQRDRNLLFISPRQLLAKEAEERLDIQNYQKLKEVDLFKTFSSSQVCTLESLPDSNITSYANSKTLFVIDEFITAMNQLDSNINDERRKRILDVLPYVIKNAGNTAILDANLRDIDYEFLLNYTGITEFQILENSYLPRIKRILDAFPSRESAEVDFVKRIRKGEKIFLPCDTKARCDYYQEICEKNNVSVININSQSKHDYEDDFLRINQLIEDKKPQVFILSPTGFVGISIELEDYFDRIFLDFSGSTCDPYQLLQALHRERNYSLPVSAYVENYTQKNPETDWCSIYEKNIERMSKLNKLIFTNFNEDGFYELDMKYIHWFIYRAKHEADINSIYKTGVDNWFYKKVSGYCKIKYKKDISDNIKNAIRNRNRLVNEKKRDELKQALIDTAIINLEEYNRIIEKQRTKVISLDEHLQKQKYDLSVAYSFTDKTDVDSLFDLSLKPEKLLRIADRVKAISDPISFLQSGKEKWNKAVIKLRYEDAALSGLVFKQIIDHIDGKEFSNETLEELFTAEFIENLSTITGKDYYQVLLDNLNTKSNYRELKELLGAFVDDMRPLAFTPRKQILESFNILSLEENKYSEFLYTFPEFKTRFRELKRNSKLIFRQALKQNPYVLFHVKEKVWKKVQKKEKELSSQGLSVSEYVYRLETYARKLEDRQARNSQDATATELFNYIENELHKLIETFHSKIKAAFTPSWTTILSDFMSRYGVKLIQTGQTRRHGKTYTLDISRVKNILPERIVNRCNRENHSSLEKTQFTVTGKTQDCQEPPEESEHSPELQGNAVKPREKIAV